MEEKMTIKFNNKGNTSRPEVFLRNCCMELSQLLYGENCFVNNVKFKKLGIDTSGFGGSHRSEYADPDIISTATWNKVAIFYDGARYHSSKESYDSFITQKLAENGYKILRARETGMRDIEKAINFNVPKQRKTKKDMLKFYSASNQLLSECFSIQNPEDFLNFEEIWQKSNVSNIISYEIQEEANRLLDLNYNDIDIANKLNISKDAVLAIRTAYGRECSRRMTEEKRNNIISLLKKGKTAKSTAEIVNCDVNYITIIAQEEGIVLGNALTDEEKSEILLLHNSGKTPGEIALIVNRHESTIRRFLERNGLKPNVNPSQKNRKKSKEEELAVLELFDSGASYSTITALTGCSESKITNIVKKYGRELRCIRYDDALRDSIAEDLKSGKFKNQEIADRHGVYKDFVSKVSREYGITNRMFRTEEEKITALDYKKSGWKTIRISETMDIPTSTLEKWFAKARKEGNL